MRQMTPSIVWSSYQVIGILLGCWDIYYVQRRLPSGTTREQAILFLIGWTTGWPFILWKRASGRARALRRQKASSAAAARRKPL